MTWLGRLFSALLGGVNPLRDGLAALWQAACRNPWQALLVLALGAAGVLGWMLHHEREDNARLRADIAEIAKSQRQAARDQAAINHAPAAISQAIAKESRADEKALYEAGRRAGAAYADAHRVRASAPVCAASDADLRGADRVAAQHDGAGPDGELVAITATDFDICTAAGQRLAKVHADAEALIAAGVAVPDRSTGGQ